MVLMIFLSLFVEGGLRLLGGKIKLIGSKSRDKDFDR